MAYGAAARSEREDVSCVAAAIGKPSPSADHHFVDTRAHDAIPDRSCHTPVSQSPDGQSRHASPNFSEPGAPTVMASTEQFIRTSRQLGGNKNSPNLVGLNRR